MNYNCLNYYMAKMWKAIIKKNNGEEYILWISNIEYDYWDALKFALYHCSDRNLGETVVKIIEPRGE